MKHCPECKTDKPLDMFSKNASRYDGLQGQCKECRSARRKADYISNKERETKLALEWRKNNPEATKAIRKRHYENNTEKCISRSVKYRRDNPAWAKAVDKKSGKKWRAANRGICNAGLARYRSSKLNATPPWLTEEHYEQIKLIYAHAKECEMLTGDKYHVDHIVPLQGESVSGLHVPWNLQVLPADINIAKGNRHDHEY